MTTAPQNDQEDERKAAERREEARRRRRRRGALFSALREESGTDQFWRLVLTRALPSFGMPLGTVMTILFLLEDERWRHLGLVGIVVLQLCCMIAGTLVGIVSFTVRDEATRRDRDGK